VTTGIDTLRKGASALDAAETGICSVEDDPDTHSVGTGGIPNIEGVVELDASIMIGNTHQSGAVTGLVNTKNPISVARKVMELCPHVMLSGEGALHFARACGFEEYDPLTPWAKDRWESLRKLLFSAMKNEISFAQFTEKVGYNIEPEKIASALELLIKSGEIREAGTVGTLCLDAKGMIVAGTSTSGLPIHLPGRVADSSVIGAGTFASESGAASSTGIGEYVIRHTLSRKVCDYIEERSSPTEACEKALLQMIQRENVPHFIGLIALDRKGEVGGACISNEAHQFTFQYQRLSDGDMHEVTPKPVKLKS
jgi:N4-(beta-N-acetylglucosaminyl)-L-asparaginase